MRMEDVKNVYFIGIGGIGMSALARYFNKVGANVEGYDRTPTTLTKKLESEGMKIHFEEKVQALPKNIDLVVYTPAIPDTHKELVHLRETGIPIMKRAQALGVICNSLKTIAIAGTHGKTTTSSMTAWLLHESGIDITAFLGGIATDFGGNFIFGEGDWVVVEADEFDRSFLHLYPELAVILSMDADHLDIYEEADAIIDSGFKAFANQLKPEGKIWVEEHFIHQLGVGKAQSFGLENADYRAENIRVKNGSFVFDYVSPKLHLNDLLLSMAGRHNVMNACAALTIAIELGADTEKLRTALANFKGISRRFERIFQDEHVVYIDDYAHHPTELNAAIGAAKELFPNKKITGIFQPHLFSRTNDFADGFAEALNQLDEAILLEIYPARELPMEGVNSTMLIDKMQIPNKQLLSKDAALDWVSNNEIEILLTLGAGDIGAMVKDIKEILETKNN